MSANSVKPPLAYTALESRQANEGWGANCGPHSLAAATGKSLNEVRAHLDSFAGWMNPTAMRAALLSMGIGFWSEKGLRTVVLCNGINRIQWEGKWLNPGVPKAAAYRQTHWVAHFDEWVLCTVCDPTKWISMDAWCDRLADLGNVWHVTHHYELPKPVKESEVPA